jgi:ABC-type cobalamin/Fe3+-siderophores transport system ATPase subunit
MVLQGGESSTILPQGSVARQTPTETLAEPVAHFDIATRRQISVMSGLQLKTVRSVDIARMLTLGRLQDQQLSEFIKSSGG